MRHEFSTDFMKQLIQRRPFTVALSVGLLITGGGLSGGCSTKTPLLIPVNGIVTLDGKPLPAAVVEFEQPKGMNMATGLTGEDGRFTLMTYKIGAGATLGEHRVQVSCREDPAPGKTKWISPKGYASFDTSGLSAEVMPKQNTFTFELASQGPGGTR
jgi:hypothetical protein